MSANNKLSKVSNGQREEEESANSQIWRKYRKLTLLIVKDGWVFIVAEKVTPNI